MSLKSAYASRQSTPTLGRGSSCSTLSPRPVDSHAPSLNLTLYGSPAPRSVHRSSKPQKPPSKPAPSPVNGHSPPTSPGNRRSLPISPAGASPNPPTSPGNGSVRGSPKSPPSPVNESQSNGHKHPSRLENGSQSDSPKPAPSLVNGSQSSSPKSPSSLVNGSQRNSPKHPPRLVNGNQRSSPKSTYSPSNGSQSGSPKAASIPMNGCQSNSPKPPSTPVNGCQNNGPKPPSSLVNRSQSNSPKPAPSLVNGSHSNSPKPAPSLVNGSHSNSPKLAPSLVNGSPSGSPKLAPSLVNGSPSGSPKPAPSLVNGSPSGSPKPPSSLVNGSSPKPAPSRPSVNGHQVSTTKTSRYEQLPTPEAERTRSSLRDVSTLCRSVSPLDLSSLSHDDDDEVSPRVSSRTVSEVETESFNIDLARMCNRCLSETSSLMTGRSRNSDEPLADGTESVSIGLLSGKSSTSSYVTISDYSTQSCSSLPRDDVTPASRQRSSDNASLCSDDVTHASRRRSSDNGRRRFMLERLESGYYSPDSTEVRLSVGEVLEAADYAHRLATLLDLALGRELGLEHADSHVSPGRDQFLENVGRHPVFTSQNVESKVKYFESVEKLFEPPPPPLPLPYEGFQTVHDGTCFCCGPRVFFSPEDLLTQRSKLKKAPVKQFEVSVQQDRDLCEVLKDVIARRRDGVMPAESVRSDWSADERG